MDTNTSSNQTVPSAHTFTHKMIVDSEPVNILGAAPTRPEAFAKGRGENFFVVQGAHCKFIAHKNDLMSFEAIERDQAREERRTNARREQREERD